MSDHELKRVITKVMVGWNRTCLNNMNLVKIKVRTNIKFMVKLSWRKGEITILLRHVCGECPREIDSTQLDNSFLEWISCCGRYSQSPKKDLIIDSWTLGTIYVWTKNKTKKKLQGSVHVPSPNGLNNISVIFDI